MLSKRDGERDRIEFVVLSAQITRSVARGERERERERERDRGSKRRIDQHRIGSTRASQKYPICRLLLLLCFVSVSQNDLSFRFPHFGPSSASTTSPRILFTRSPFRHHHLPLKAPSFSALYLFDSTRLASLWSSVVAHHKRAWSYEQQLITPFLPRHFKTLSPLDSAC